MDLDPLIDMEENEQMMDGDPDFGGEQLEGPQNFQSGYEYDNSKKYHNNYRNDRYNNAYGNYSGGYGPPGGYGNYRNFGPRGHFYPQANFALPQPPMFQGPPQNFSWGRGFGLTGPPIRKNPMDDRTIRYLMRCGVTKEHLKNLPRDLLALIEPEYCGLCAQSLDSFATSRIHYISKNHLKNQRKWLTQQSEVGPRWAKEIPLKSRELYCELCDVHITSKTHSDSHYAGKMHRSIVVGRKNPRNPFLLQEGMEERVEQLIRREKKHLKPADEEEKEVEKKDVRPISSELYCDICKTSVTCSDQMTMHLNGKRHLAKEKQHILKVMKAVGSSTVAGAEATQGEHQDGLEEENENKEEGDYDWENGGEKWEEAPKSDG